MANRFVAEIAWRTSSLRLPRPPRRQLSLLAHFVATVAVAVALVIAVSIGDVL